MFFSLLDLTFHTHFTKKLAKLSCRGLARSKLTSNDFSMGALQIFASMVEVVKSKKKKNFSRYIKEYPLKSV